MATDGSRAPTRTARTASADPARPSQREQAATEARTRILAAAADCIVRDGLAQVRMASIARTAGVSAGLLHYHFDTKELLFGEVLRYSHEVSAELNQRALSQAGDGPAERLSSFLDRCLPSDEQRADEWLLWQELALLCIRDPHLATVGAELYEDLYATLADIVSDGVASGVFATALDPRWIAETAVALTDGLGGRVLARDPNLGIVEARSTIAATVGILVGHDGPLPAPVRLEDAAGA
jgi:AcrR family transcriptional regulator